MGKRKTTEQFIKDAKEKHGNKFNYKNVDYKKSNIKVKIICNKCNNMFEQLPNSHLRGRKCPTCSGRLKNVDTFIKSSLKVHKGAYSYDFSVYEHSKKKVKILCKNHGIFEQTPNSHMKGRGCPICADDYIKSRTKTTSNFIKDAIKIHGDKYNYDLVDYKNCKTKIKILCKKHGIFEQKPNTHLSGRGCAKCNSSKGEIEIATYLNKRGIKYVEQYRFKNQPKEIKACRYDFYLPDYNTIIEYHGIQHINFIPHFHGDILSMLSRRKRDYEKMKFCENNNINFIEIHYNHKIKDILDNYFNN